MCLTEHKYKGNGIKILFVVVKAHIYFPPLIFTPHLQTLPVAVALPSCFTLKCFQMANN